MWNVLSACLWFPHAFSNFMLYFCLFFFFFLQYPWNIHLITSHLLRRWGLLWIKILNLYFIALENVGLPLSDWLSSSQQIFIWRLNVLWQCFFGLSHSPFRVEDIKLRLILASTSQCFGNKNIYCKWVRPRPHSSNAQLLYHCNSTGSNSFLWVVQFHFSRTLVPFLQILRKTE